MGRSGTGRTYPFNLSGKVPLERCTASCDRWQTTLSATDVGLLTRPAALVMMQHQNRTRQSCCLLGVFSHSQG